MENIQDRALGWDDEITQESEFVLLEPGTYDFEVTALEKAYFNGSEKMAPCPQARLELTVQPSNAKVFTNLFLNTKSEWKLSEFFTSIGLKKKGEPLKMQWNKVLGLKGKCTISNNEYNGKTYNNVDKFLEPVEQTWAPGKF